MGELTSIEPRTAAHAQTPLGNVFRQILVARPEMPATLGLGGYEHRPIRLPHSQLPAPMVPMRALISG